MTKYYSINELCRMTSVSVRTLHYYDEIDLLKPGHRTAKGHRLYTNEELLRLQQIVTFRFLGFTLSQIRLIMKSKNDMFHLIKLQADAIADEAARIDKVSKFFNYLIAQHEQSKTIDWQSAANIIEVFKQKETDCEQWYQRYLSSDELLEFKKHVKTRTSKWLDLFAEVKQNLQTNPRGHVGKTLVKKWVMLADEAYGDQPALRDKLWQAYQSGLIPADFFPYDKDVIAYLSQAFSCYPSNGESK